MAKFYSPSQKGFFDDRSHGSNKPDDAVQVSDDVHADFLSNNGKEYHFNLTTGDFSFAPDSLHKWSEEESAWIEDNAKVTFELDSALNSKLSEIDKVSREKIESGFDSDALGSLHKYDCRRGLDPVDLSLAIEGAIESGIDVDFMCQAPDQHFSDKTHTLAQLRLVAVDMRNHIQANRVIARSLKSAATNARNANDLAAIQAVDPSNWV